MSVIIFVFFFQKPKTRFASFPAFDEWMEFIIEQVSGLQNLACLVAIFLFLNARSLVRSVLIFYTMGVLLGVFASFLLLGSFIQRLVPKAFRLPFFFGGWPLSAYIYYMTWRNLDIIFREYQFYAIIYLCFFTLISLAVCYRLGPPKDERSLNLAEWTLQLISVAIIFFLTKHEKIAITIIFSLIFITFWRRYSMAIIRVYRRTLTKIKEILFGPQPRHLLSEKEYLDESQIYTRMELDRLRQFCQSQDSRKNWRLISRLHTPNKMASFITGDSDHVSRLESTYHSDLFGDQDDEIEEQQYSTDDYITDDDEN